MKFTLIRALIMAVSVVGYGQLSARAPFLTAKELSHPPSNVIRTCCAFGMDLSIALVPFAKKTDITSINDMGTHHYMGDKNEGNGIIYTHRGGFIDLGHLRDYADWTAYLYSLIHRGAENGEDVILDLGSEGGAKTLHIKDPQDLSSSDQYELAGKIAYDLSVWHEIATWYGASYIPMVPERYSSFSPEDLYSNLLGVKLGILALKSDLDYNEAMTQILATTLDSLEVVRSMEETYAAMQQVENIWWTREKPLPSRKILLRRYLDLESSLVPWLLPIDKENQTACKLDNPFSMCSDQYELKIELTRRVSFMSSDEEQFDRIVTQNDFEELIDSIEEDQRNQELKTAWKLQKMNLRKERRVTEHNKKFQVPMGKVPATRYSL